MLMCKVCKLNMWPIMNILGSTIINRTYMAPYDTTVTVLTVCTTDIHLSESDVVSVLLGRGWGLGLLGRVCAHMCVCVGGG